MATVGGSGNRPLRGALLGTGNISLYQMRAWQAIPEVEIVAMANRTRSRAEKMAREFGVADEHVYADYRELLSTEELDFVDIATAAPVHREQVLAAAAQGVHCLVQKPFATTMDEALEMIGACEAAGVRCVVNDNFRWRRWCRNLKRLVDQGIIGRPNYACFQVHRDDLFPTAEGGLPLILQQQPYKARTPRLVLYEWGVHHVDVMRFLFGDIKHAHFRMGRVSPLVAGDDRVVAILEFHSGLIGLIDISWVSFIRQDRRMVKGNLEPFVVEGDAGTIELDPFQGDVMMITTARGTERIPAHPNISPAEVYQESFTNAQRHFAECLRSGEMAENEARDNLKTLSVVAGAYDEGWPV